MRVLVVDDDEIIRQMLKSFFSRRGDICLEAASGTEALHLLEDRIFDVLLSDIRMPEMDGLELVKRAKAIQLHTACVLISGLGSRRDIISALKAGVFDFVDKPILNLEEFTMVMERAAESSRLTQERDSLLETLKQQNTRLEFSLLRLHEAFGQLRQQEEALESDLVRAQRVQRTLLPAAFPHVDGLDFFGYFAPCEHLGGDFFGTLRLNDGKLAVYLVDVAGHGVSAAMVTVTLRELMRTPQRTAANTDLYGAPARVLTFINEALVAEAFDPPIYVTMVYAVFDPATGTVTLASAGHPPPLLVSDAGEQRPVAVQGPVLGATCDHPFARSEIVLNPGDTMLFYSDGVTDARNASEEDFAVERLRQTLIEHGGETASEIGSAIEHAMAEHLKAQPAADDVTYIVACRSRVAGAPDLSLPTNGGAASTSVRMVMPGRLRFFPPEGRGRIKGGWTGQNCIIRLGGLATWQLASSFREMIKRAGTDGAASLHVDLAECEALDSTIAGLLLQYAGMLTLHQMGARVAAQLREMGVLERFTVSHEPCPPFESPIAIEPSVSREACSELILAAHEALMEASANNRQRFGEVVASLRAQTPPVVPAAGK